MDPVSGIGVQGIREDRRHNPMHLIAPTNRAGGDQTPATAYFLNPRYLKSDPWRRPGKPFY